MDRTESVIKMMLDKAYNTLSEIDTWEDFDEDEQGRMIACYCSGYLQGRIDMDDVHRKRIKLN